ncbi:TetR/AcrR family transcriptional regulator [Amycolatopsis saalfeldensis]|uniref:DNA-binding transcriptional regulator, AcrR family n=1 Tax=Amycolatopsis saalfeldensis TaxID=394193 RepID=A0A1H8XEU1_9PSEU|nr:TetR/AcrR family transcriptional regulator [Amycolatopsis saalfeldensis]SEP38425.1 DNA-binding transcriptional regulator, AcrR family [Amycolatopsis saalfeldensis]
MGLREKKAQKVREAIYDAMITLVEQGGYEAATLEQVAERAEVGISTLYRYYANKDAILLDPFERNIGGLADLLRARPEGERVVASLGEVVHSVADVDQDALARQRRLRAQLDLAPGPRARLWDVLHRQRVSLEDAIAERSGRDDLWNAAAAQLTIMVITMTFDHDRESLDETTPADYADRILATLHGTGAPLPVRD